MTSIENSLNEYLGYLEIEKNRSPKTRENYERYLNLFMKQAGVTNLKDLNEETIRDFRLKLARGSLKKITQGYYIIALRNFLKFLIKKD